MSSQITTTGISSGSLGTVGQPWRNPVMVMSDGYRVVVYFDGTNNRIATSANGTAWTVQTPTFGTPAVGMLTSTCTPSLNGSQYLAAASLSGTNILLTAFRYNGNGTFGAGVSSTLPFVSNVQSIVAVPFGASGNGNNGSIVVLGDNGSWYLSTYFFSGTTWSAGTNITYSPQISGPTYATNMIVRAGVEIYVISPGSNSWSAVDFAFNNSNGAWTSGALETPTLPVSSNGAALALSDGSSNPGIDLYATTTSGIYTQTRGGSGGYSNPQNLGGSGLNGAATASLATNTGNKIVYSMASFGGINHVGACAKTNNLWSAFGQNDSSTSALQSFVGPDDASYGTTGVAEVYVNSATPAALNYDDGGTVAASNPPSAPTGVKLVNAPGTDEAHSVTSPFNCTTLTPTFQSLYTDSSPTDQLGSRRYVVAVFNGGTVWDSGQVALINGPVSGGTVTDRYGSIGNAATGLGYNGHYTLTVYHWDKTTGAVSPASSTIEFFTFNVPAATLTAPSGTVSTFTPTATFSWSQAQGLTAQTVQITFKDSGGTIRHDTGVITYNPTIASGAQTNLALASIVPDLANYTTYTATLRMQVSNGPSATSTTTITTSFTGAAAPSAVTAVPHAGTTALIGPYVTLGCTLVAGSGGSALASINTYQRLNGTTPWTFIKNTPNTAGGAVSVNLYSSPIGKAMDYAVSTVSANGIESALVPVLNVTLTGRLGLVFNDPANPTNDIEIGLVPGSSSALLDLESIQQKTMRQPFNRLLPVFDVGTQYAFHTMQSLTMILELGYEQPTLDLIHAWDKAGTPIQFRDSYGHVIYVVFLKVSEGAIARASIRTVTVDFHQADPGQYNLLAV